MTPARPKAVVLCNAPALPADHPDAASEADVLNVARAVAAALDQHGFRAEIVAVGPPIATALRDLLAAGPDVVFNLMEGFGGRSAGATAFTAVLELTGLPCTGCPSDSLALAQSKARAKALLRGFGLPTAPGALVRAGAPWPEWTERGPVILKPDAEDGSLGIDQDSVLGSVHDPAARDRAARLFADYGGEVLIEAYLPGREFNVGVVDLDTGPVALPIAELVYGPAPGLRPILTYAAKWDTGSIEDLATVPRCPALIDRELADRLGGLAIEAFGATRCRDYARIDIRLDGCGEPMILEVNPNPDLGPAAGWARALRASGRDYAVTIAGLARQALARGIATFGRAHALEPVRPEAVRSHRQG